jgi:septal ring factor EnvC (AmiA/AmiB activator)
MLQFRHYVFMNRRMRPFLPVAALAVTSVLAVAQQDDRGRTDALAARATRRMEALHREADRLASEERTLIGDLRRLELERQIKVEELRQLDADARQVERELSETSARVARLQDDRSTALPQLESRLVEIYKLGQARYARLLLSTADARSLGHAVRMATALAKLDRDRIAANQKTIDDLAASRATLEARARRLDVVRAEARQTEAEAARAAQARASAIGEIDRRRDLNAQLAGELEAAQRKLQASVRSLGSGAAASAAPTSVTALPLKAFRGDLAWPVAGTVRRRFGVAGAGGSLASNGVEIGALEGMPVAAVHEGTVAFAGPFSGYGNLVIVDHGGQAFSLYGNLLEIDVKQGVTVEAGQPVGAVGASVTGPAALYFELRVDGQPVDPLQWLREK